MMSYSRWSDSTWYTYWSVLSGETVPETQQLMIHYNIDKQYVYQYNEEYDVNTFVMFIGDDLDDDVSIEELSELKGYIDEFRRDVEEEFNIRNATFANSVYYGLIRELQALQNARKNDKVRPKAIRDKLYEPVQNDGGLVATMYDDGFLPYMENKVLEEFSEYLENRDLEEFCDLLDVLERIQVLNGWTDEEISEVRERKNEDRGKFYDNRVLVYKKT